MTQENNNILSGKCPVCKTVDLEDRAQGVYYCPECGSIFTEETGNPNLSMLKIPKGLETNFIGFKNERGYNVTMHFMSNPPMWAIDSQIIQEHTTVAIEVTRTVVYVDQSEKDITVAYVSANAGLAGVPSALYVCLHSLSHKYDYDFIKSSE